MADQASSFRERDTIGIDQDMTPMKKIKNTGNWRTTANDMFKTHEGIWKDENPYKTLLHPLQKEAAQSVVDAFAMGEHNRAVLIAPVQAGKTGTFRHICRLMATHIEDSVVVKYSSIFICTALSDTAWLKQTQDDFPRYIDKQIKHRPTLRELPKLIDKAIQNDEGVLIIWDEMQHGAKPDQTVDKQLSRYITDTDFMKRHRIFVVLVSATPSHLFHHLKMSADSFHQQILEVGDNYVGPKTFHTEGRVMRALDLKNKKDRTLLYTTIQNRFGDGDPRYHIVRTLNKVNLNDRPSGWSSVCFDSQTDMTVEQFDKMLSQRPINHTFVCIKGRYRAGKRMDDRFIGAVVETNTKDATVGAQGLAGRMMGYGKQRGPRAPVIFIDMELLNQYMELHDKMDYSLVPKYNSTDVKKYADSEEVGTKPSFMERSAVMKRVERTKEYPFKVCNTIDDVQECLTSHGYRKYNETEIEKHKKGDFYECFIRNSWAVRTFEEVDANKFWGLGKTEKGRRRVHPCYTDMDDPSSLKFVVVYMEKEGKSDTA